MKKSVWLTIIALLIAFMATGCKEQPQEEVQIPEPTVPWTDNALFSLPLESGTYQELFLLGENILLCDDSGNLALLSTKTGQIIATKEAGKISGLSVSGKAVCYFSPDSCEVVYLDEQLVETQRVKLPEEMRGEPAFCAGGQEIFYCIGKEIRALDMETGIARLVKEFTDTSFHLTGVHFDGTLLSGKVLLPGQIDLDTTSSVAKIYGQACFYSAVDGSLLWQDGNLLGKSSFFYLQTFGDRYYLSRVDGVVYQAIYGDRSTEEAVVVGVLSLEGKFAKLLELGLLLHLDEESNLRLYDMKTGAVQAEISVAELGTSSGYIGDEVNQCVWFLSKDEQGKQSLCRWNYEKSPAASDSKVSVEKLYTSMDPDAEGLKACQDAADTLYEKYGVRVDIWQDAVKAHGNYAMVPEYQPTAIMKRLERIEAVLAQLPESVVKKLVTDGELHIGIVRSIDNSGKVVQYWQDGVAYIAVSVYADIEKTLLLEIFRVMDVYVIGNSQFYDEWTKLNPEDFTYGTQDAKYLEQGNMAFVDGMAMNNPVEDRIRILTAAMQPDNGELFQNPVLRNKLQCISNAIRQAYDLEKYDQKLPWEQYL